MDPLLELRETLRTNEWLIIPHADAFQGGELAPNDERLHWVSGFTGSSGTALISRERALLFVDGRYTLQSREEVSKVWEIVHTAELSPEIFLEQTLADGSILSFDPWLHTFAQYQQFASLRCALNPLKQNPIDRLWKDRPSPPFHLVSVHPHHFAGESSQQKRQRLVQDLGNADCLLSTDSQSIAWLLNIRGQDTPYTPIVHAYALLYKEERVDLFVDTKKITSEVSQHLGDTVRICPLEALQDHLKTLKTYCIDPNQAPAALILDIQKAGGKIRFQPDPSVICRAIKNPIEITGAASAHVRDGLAIVRFLAWLAGHPSISSLTEWDCAQVLLQHQERSTHFRGPSFAFCSASGPQAAIIHYHPTADQSCRLDSKNLYLIDAGGQYLDGTTDMTRTISFSDPTPEQRHHYTLVLKGHIALASCQFPQGTRGNQLDALARQYLWKEGLDYPHGTGHGVGSYLGVHEGPQRISPSNGTQPLLPGMILSNEPGYYKKGNYGIRIESLMVVEKRDHPSAKPWLGFQTLTLVPFDRCLIDTILLTPDERNWINAYHQKILSVLAPELDEETLMWLKAATARI